MKTTPCKGCGKPMVWAETEDGKRIPLDPRPPVYKVWRGDNDKAECLRADRYGFMVSHFATCPKANDFSGSKK